MDTDAFLKTLDYAILKPEATMMTLLHAAACCKALGVGCLCVKSCDVPFAAEQLAESGVAVAAVVGFPHGNTVGALKALEAQLAVASGATEIDMVINCAAYTNAAHPAPVKVILETALLTEAEMRRGVECAVRGGAAFVKTSTGFAPQGGATPEAVRILLDAAAGRVKVKASGGIRTREAADAYLAMGCARLGVGNVLPLLTEAERARFGV